MQRIAAIAAIVLVVAVMFYLVKKKKSKEQQMSEELDSLIEAEDWNGVGRLLRKQLILWGTVAVLATALTAASFIIGKPKFMGIVISAISIWRTIKLARSYKNARYNERWKQNEAEAKKHIAEQVAQTIRLLNEYGIKASQIAADITPQSAMQIWQEAREKGKKDGFCPVILQIYTSTLESMNDEMREGKEQFKSWQRQALNSPTADGKTLLMERFESQKENYEKEADWQGDIVGTAEPCEAADGFYFNNQEDSILLLAEIPAKEPWQIFAYIPFGDWNDCPSAEVHMAVAKYWQEKYGAEVACIAPDVVTYKTPRPADGDTMTLAEEQFAYSEDVLQDYGNLSTLAEVDKKSTIWTFFWD